MESAQVIQLAKKVVNSFIRRMPSATHLREELQQEAAIAILLCAPRYRPGTMSLTTFLWPRAWKALQTHTSALAGPVNRVANSDGFHGTSGAAIYDGASSSRPDDILARTQADRDFRRLCMDAAASFKNPQQVAEILHQALSGATYDEVGKTHGLSRQRINQIVQRSGLAALVAP